MLLRAVPDFLTNVTFEAKFVFNLSFCLNVVNKYAKDDENYDAFQFDQTH